MAISMMELFSDIYLNSFMLAGKYCNKLYGEAVNRNSYESYYTTWPTVRGPPYILLQNYGCHAAITSSALLERLVVGR